MAAQPKGNRSSIQERMAWLDDQIARNEDILARRRINCLEDSADLPRLRCLRRVAWIMWITFFTSSGFYLGASYTLGSIGAGNGFIVGLIIFAGLAVAYQTEANILLGLFKRHKAAFEDCEQETVRMLRAELDWRSSYRCWYVPFMAVLRRYKGDQYD